MERPCQEWKISIVVVRDCIGQCLIPQRHEMLKIDVKRREVVDTQAVDLGDVVFVGRHGA